MRGDDMKVMADLKNELDYLIEGQQEKIDDIDSQILYARTHGGVKEPVTLLQIRACLCGELKAYYKIMKFVSEGGVNEKRARI